MFVKPILTCVVCAMEFAMALPAIFGTQGAESPVPQNTAQYLLDLEAQDIYLHYCGEKMLFSLRFSPNFKSYLEKVASAATDARMPVVYGANALSPEGHFDWAAAGVPRWSASSGADSTHVFYGREVRHAQNALYGNSIHLVLGPEADPEGWTAAEMEENRNFAEAILKGTPVGTADWTYRKFRSEIAAQLGGDFVHQFGEGVTTKAHRLALQMYSADSQSEASRPGTLYFEMFPGNRPPTTNVVFLEAEDGCKGTPTPQAKVMPTIEKFEAHVAEADGMQAVLSAFSGCKAMAVAGCVSTLIFVACAAGVVSCRFRIRGEQRSDTLLTEDGACE